MQFHMGLWGLLICAVLLYLGHGSGSDILDPVMPDTRAWLYRLDATDWSAPQTRASRSASMSFRELYPLVA